ncbi:MAG: hypothetical protein KJ737_00505 [Proteobacteria bacterium]|nr:hypothetical protein [Pseudomonadota bacterium]
MKEGQVCRSVCDDKASHSNLDLNELLSLIQEVGFGRIENILVENGRMIKPQKVIKKIKITNARLQLPQLINKIGEGLIFKIEVANGKIGIVHIEMPI